MFAPVTHITPLTTVRRTRLLPVPGDVLVRTGQTVRATEVIATAITSPKHVMINVARGLGLSEDEADQYIERYVEEEVVAGDVIATRSGIGKRIVRSPVEGTIKLITAGQVLVQVKNEPIELRAGFPGTVVELIHERGAVISATGALVQGVWGNGKINFGLLNVLADSPDHVLSPDQVNVGVRGAVIMAGHCDQAKTLQNGAENRIRGLILGSLAPELVSRAARMPYPIVVIDGFYRLPMNEVAYKLLSTNNQRDVALNAEAFQPLKNSRPEILIPLPGGEDSDVSLANNVLSPGQRVRIVRAPHRGKIATIEAILPNIIFFPNGLRAPGARLRLENGDSIQAPLANLEIIY